MRRDLILPTAPTLDVLGFKKTDAQKVLDKLFTENPDLTTEMAVKKAIKML